MGPFVAAILLAMTALTFFGCNKRSTILPANAAMTADPPAYTRVNVGESLGESLYMTHCSACHTAEIHWRKQNLATDWDSLVAQVERWKTSIGLGWSKEEITDVARYLNTAHYGFPEPGRKGYSQSKRPDQLLRR